MLTDHRIRIVEFAFPNPTLADEVRRSPSKIVIPVCNQAKSSPAEGGANDSLALSSRKTEKSLQFLPVVIV